MKVAVLGMGIIGSVWAHNLRESGCEVRSWNRTPKNLPGFEPDARKAVTGAEFILIAVADPKAVENVLAQIASALQPGQLVIQSSTISAAYSIQFAKVVEKTGATFLEAPFTGSKLAAEKRETVFYAGGPSELLEKARPMLKLISKVILHVGPLGSASSLKLALNLNLAVLMQGLSESLTLARREGIADDVFFEALRANAGWSAMTALKEPKIKKGDFAPQFSLKHMAKDLKLALETASQKSSDGLPIATQLNKEVYAKGMEKPGWPEEDYSGLIRLLS